VRSITRGAAFGGRRVRQPSPLRQRGAGGGMPLPPSRRLHPSSPAARGRSPPASSPFPLYRFLPDSLILFRGGGRAGAPRRGGRARADAEGRGGAVGVPQEAEEDARGQGADAGDEVKPAEGRPPPSPGRNRQPSPARRPRTPPRRGRTAGKTATVAAAPRTTEKPRSRRRTRTSPPPPPTSGDPVGEGARGDGEGRLDHVERPPQQRHVPHGHAGVTDEGSGRRRSRSRG